MLEILFKGKRIDNGEWVEGNLIQSGEKHRPIDREDVQFSNSYIISNDKESYTDCSFGGCEWKLVSHAIHIDAETICQYTGMKDKNGKKIFEGDIVVLDEDVKKTFNVDDGEVRWGWGGFYIKEFSTLNSLNTVASYNCILRGKVIGNIYDHSELLNT